jgi:HSP20 family protein
MLDYVGNEVLSVNDEKIKRLMELASSMYGTDFWKDIFDQNMMGSLLANGQQQKNNVQTERTSGQHTPPVGTSSVNMNSFPNPNQPNYSNGEPKFPLVDIIKKDGKIIILIDLPGIKKEEVQLKANQNYLIVKGNSKLNINEIGGEVLFSERKQGPFERHILLPSPTGGNLSANFQNGVLEVSYPLPEEEGEIIPID